MTTEMCSRFTNYKFNRRNNHRGASAFTEQRNAKNQLGRWKEWRRVLRVHAETASSPLLPGRKRRFLKTRTAAVCSGDVTAGTTRRDWGYCKSYVRYSLDHTKGQPLPGLHPSRPLNWVNKTVTEFRCNSLSPDLKEKFIVRLHGYLWAVWLQRGRTRRASVPRVAWDTQGGETQPLSAS